MTSLNIKSKIILYHFILVIILVSGLGYHQYKNQLQSHISSLIHYHTASSSSIVSMFSQAIAGFNYANIQMPSFIAELKRNKTIYAMQVSGVSNNNRFYKVLFKQVTGEIWRGQYSKNYSAEVISNLELLQTQEQKKADKVQIDFLIARNQERLERYNNSILLSKNNNELTALFKQKNTPFVDLKYNRLFISIPTNNKHGGKVQIIFDISEIQAIKSQILEDILYESILALLLSIIILTILARQITSPINSLSNYISQNYEDHNLAEMPCISRNDEIGVLAKTLYRLLEQIMSYENKLKILSQKDPLTGLGNRRELDYTFENRQFSETMQTAVLYLDIDHFKKYNDRYGHNMGDETLKKVADSIDNSIQRKGDNAFRIGGEEFVVLITISNIEQMKNLAERIRKNVQALAIEHKLNPPYDVITISIGAYLTILKPKERTTRTLSEMLNYADKSLYLAKKSGRNCLIIY